MKNDVITDQTGIPCLFMRGGTSRGPFFLASDLPDDEATRNKVLLAVMGSPDKRQIDGLGGANPLTSKVGIVSPGSLDGVDLDFLFVQLQPDSELIDTTPNCGNMLAAVVPFAIERGLMQASEGDVTTARVLTQNTGMQCDISVITSGAQVHYAGTTKIDGVPGSAAPISINFLDTAGSVCSGLLPTGRVLDTMRIDSAGTAAFSIDVTCIDNGMPMVLMRASDLQRRGDESVESLNKDTELKTRIEAIRLQAGHLMGLGDVSKKNYPKMCLLAAPQHGGSIATRCFIPHVCHDAIGVLAAVTVATACVLKSSIAFDLTRQDVSAATGSDDAMNGNTQSTTISVEHPSGEFSVELGLEPALESAMESTINSAMESAATPSQRVNRAALLRTARLIMRGEVMIPSTVWKGK